jgi:membrane protein
MRSLIERIRNSYVGRLLQAYGSTNAGNYAGSIALSMFMSMFPLMLGILAIVGLVIRNPSTQASVTTSLLGFFPSDAGKALTSVLKGVKQNSGVLGVIGLVGMVWSGTSIFTTMEWALDRMFGAPQRDFVRQRLMGLLMTVLFAAVILLSVGLNSALSIAKVVPFIGPIVGLVVWVLFMLAIYRVVPHRTFKMSEIWRGAVLAGVLMEVLSLLWPLYTHFTHDFGTYGASFALFFLLATWLTFLSQLVLLGAVANRLALGEPITEGPIADPGTRNVETPETDVIEGRRKPAL